MLCNNPSEFLSSALQSVTFTSLSGVPKTIPRPGDLLEGLAEVSI